MKGRDYVAALTDARKIDDIIACIIQTGEYSRLIDKLKEYSKQTPNFNTAVFSTRKSQKSIALLTALVCITSAVFFIMAVLIIASYNYGADKTILPTYILATIAVVLLVNLIFVLLIRKNKNISALFKTIKPYIASKHICYLTDVNALTKVPEKKIRAVLNWAIKTGLIPSGKLVFGNQVLLTTARLVDYYENNKDECDAYFCYIIGVKNSVDERPQRLNDYLAARSIDIEYIHRDFKDIKDPVIKYELAMISIRVQQFVFAADMNTDIGEYCYYLLDYYLMSSERLLRAYVQKKNTSEKAVIGNAMYDLNTVCDSYISFLLEPY